MFKRKRKAGRQQIGCGFLMGTGIVLLILFIVNNLIVRALFSVNLEEVDERLFQAAQFLLPIGMLLVQYWLFDWMMMAIRKMRSSDRDRFG
jgi:hypothetical protein